MGRWRYILCTVLLATPGFAAEESADPAPDFFPGEYQGTRSGLEASLTITDAFEYIYRQDLGDGGRIQRVTRRGDVKTTGPKTASAGRLLLHWRNHNTVVVSSPYGSGLVFDGAGGADQQRGRRFTLQRIGGSRTSNRRIVAKVTLTPTPAFVPECEADISISYVQMYDRVRVRTHVEHDGCPASSGDYTVRLRTAGEGETDTRSFEETWQREDAAPLETTTYYPMNPDHRLVWAQVKTSRKTNCRCDEPADISVSETR